MVYTTKIHWASDLFQKKKPTGKLSPDHHINKKNQEQNNKHIIWENIWST